jgi:hypothetical protein
VAAHDTFALLANRARARFDRIDQPNMRRRLAAIEAELADFCIATVQGAMLLGRIKRDSHPVEAIVEEALAHVKRYADASTGSSTVH